MKTKKGAELQKEINKVSKFLDDAPKFEGTTYRGMSLGGEQATTFNQQLKKGGMITDNGFMSTSANKNVAKNFIGTSEFEYKFTIKGKSGVVIEELTEFFGEKEVLFNINTKFKITKVKVTPKQKSVLEKNPITQKNELVLKNVADYEIELEEL